MSIQGVKGVEIGLGFEQTRRLGSEVHDVIEGRGADGGWHHRSNNAGGLTGGITNGEPLVVRGAVKPISTLARPLPSADLRTGEPVDKAHYERSDISVVPAAGVIGEAMVLLVPGPGRAREVRRRLARRGGRQPRPLPGADRRRPQDWTGWTSSSSGSPGGGKTSAGRRLARRHDAAFIDLDEIDRGRGRPADARHLRGGRRGRLPGPRTRRRSPPSATADGSPGLAPRHRDRRRRGGRSPQPLGALPRSPRRVARRAAGGARPAAPQLPRTRPLVAGRDPVGVMRTMAAARARFYAPGLRVNAIVGMNRRDRDARGATSTSRSRAAPCSCGPTRRSGDYELGDGNAVDGVLAILASLEARRAILVSEPVAWEVVGTRIAAALRAAGLPVEQVLLPTGEAAKTFGVVEGATRALARLRAERADPLVAIGGGALGDTAGFIAATWLRGVPLVHVPTTLVAQVDSAIGGKTAIDLPEGKNLVGAFYQPAAIVTDVRLLRTLPARQVRAALGEAVKMAALGDGRLFDLLEATGPALVDGSASRARRRAPSRRWSNAARWAKIEVVVADEREQGGRIAPQPRPLAGPRDRGRGRVRRGSCTVRRWPTGCARPAGSGSRSGPRRRSGRPGSRRSSTAWAWRSSRSPARPWPSPSRMSRRPW